MDNLWIIIVTGLVALNTSILGTFLVLRKATMMSDAISHAVLPGIVLSYLITKSLNSFSVIVGASTSGLVAMFLISFLNKKAKLQLDAAMGVVFTFLFALGIILISMYTKKADVDQECVLFGEVIHIPLNTWITKKGINMGPIALYNLLFIFVLNFSIIYIFYRYFYVTSFDEQYASTLGINTVFWNYVLMGLTSISTVASFEIVGVILVVALISIPTSSAYLISKRLPEMLIISSFLSIIMAVLGFYLSQILDAPVSGSMTIIGGLIFIISLLYSKIKTKPFLKKVTD